MPRVVAGVAPGRTTPMPPDVEGRPVVGGHRLPHLRPGRGRRGLRPDRRHRPDRPARPALLPGRGRAGSWRTTTPRRCPAPASPPAPATPSACPARPATTSSTCTSWTASVINQVTQIRTAMLWSALLGRKNTPVYFLRFMLPASGRRRRARRRSRAPACTSPQQMWTALAPN